MTRIGALEGALRRARVGEIRPEERLAEYTSLRVGGPCRAMVRPPDLASLERLIKALGELEVPYLPVGGGTNLLVADEGFDGVVIATDALQEWDEMDAHTLRVGAGVATTRVLKWTVRENLTGFEGLTGVPGTIGGACIMNAGGRRGEIRESLLQVEVVTSPPEVHSVTVEADALMLAYRSSSLPPGSIIGRALFQFSAADESGSVGRAVEELLEHRMATQPAGVLSVGSVFKNPEGDSAGRLIESCGLKGTREGPVVVNDMHANYLVNTGGATSRQVRALIDRIQHAVKEQTGVALEREVVTVGFMDDPLPERAWVPTDHPLRNRGRSQDREFGSVSEGGGS